MQGSYSLVEPDGTKRVVHYSADEHNGFNAVVSREPAAVAVKAVGPAIAKYAAPAVAAYAPAPAYGYAAPVAKLAYSAPSYGYSSYPAYH